MIKNIKNKKLIPVVPVVDYNKVPYLEWSNENNWIKSSEALNELEQFKRVTYKNRDNKTAYGLLTGLSLITGEASNVMVIDLDNKKGVTGENNFYNMIESLGIEQDFLDTYTIATPNNGKHLYFKYDSRLWTGTNFGEGIDVRAEGGIIPIAGTTYKVGKTLKKEEREKHDYDYKNQRKTYVCINDNDIKELPTAVIEKMIEEYYRYNDKSEATLINVKKRGTTRIIDNGSILDTVKSAGKDFEYLRDIGFQANRRSNSDRGQGICPIHGTSHSGSNFSYKMQSNGFYGYKCHSRGCVGDGHKAGTILDIVMAKEGFNDVMEAGKWFAEKYNIELPTWEIIEDAENFDHRVNHSVIKYDSMYRVKRRLSERVEGINNAIAKAEDGQTILLVAPTGSGKTYSFVNIAKTMKQQKFIIVLPNSSNVEQVGEEYKIQAIYGEKDVLSYYKREHICVMTWDKFAQLKEEDMHETIVLLDEVHQLYSESFRARAIKDVSITLGNVKGSIHITGTPNKIPNHAYDYKIKYEVENETKVNVKLYSKVSTSEVLNILDNCKGKYILQQNDGNMLEFYRENSSRKVAIVTSENKEESELHNLIIEHQTMGDYQGLLCTTVINAGVNINDADITDVIMIGFKDVAQIKQLVARARKSKFINLHIFNNYKEEDKPVYLEGALKWWGESYREMANLYNKRRTMEQCGVKMEDTLRGGTVASLPNFDNLVVLDEVLDMYIFDEVALRSNMYENYYSKRTIESFEVLMKEYFKTISIIEVEEESSIEVMKFKEDKKKHKETALEVIKDFKEWLVPYPTVFRKKGTKIDTQQEIYMLHDLKMSEKEVKEKIKELKLDRLVKNNRLTSKIQSFSDLHLNYHYSKNVAWNLATGSKAMAREVYDRIKVLVYRELWKNNVECIDTKRAEHEYIDFIIKEIPVGTSYTDEHIQILVDKLISRFGKRSGFHSKKIMEMLKVIYKVSMTNVRAVDDDMKFYDDRRPVIENGKRKRVYTATSFITAEDIKEQVGAGEEDNCIDLIIKRKIENSKNSLDIAIRSAVYSYMGDWENLK